jgi:hypothetical protein
MPIFFMLPFIIMQGLWDVTWRHDNGEPSRES